MFLYKFLCHKKDIFLEDQNYSFLIFFNLLVILPFFLIEDHKNILKNIKGTYFIKKYLLSHKITHSNELNCIFKKIIFII